MYVTAQVLGGLSIAILLGYTIVKVDRKTILICNVLINLLWAAHYFLLNAYTGGVCSSICATMVVVFFFKGRTKWLSRLYVPIFFVLIFVGFGVITWDGGFSVIPILGNVLVAAALWLDKEIVIKGIYTIVAVLWIVYNTAYFSYIGVIGQCLAFVFDVVYLCLYFYRARKAKVE